MRDITNVALRLLIIMLCAGLCLGAAYSVTKEPIAQQELQKKEEARRAVLPDAATFEEVSISNESITECYEGFDASGAPCGYAMTVTGSGFGGQIHLVVGIQDGAVLGIRIVSHSETPGLGAKSTDEAFYGQFAGKSGELSVIKSGAAGEREIHAITAATITSKAVTAAVNQALAAAADLN